MRWQHPRRGLLGPSEFITLAEETGLIVPLGRWVLHQSCEDVASWQQARAGEPPLQVSVNLSGRQLQDPEFGADLTAALVETRLAPGTLVLEITESILMHNTTLNASLLQELRQRGALLAIDDFGTGYSSLAYLLSFPIDVLKIDRVFVEHLATNANSLALTQAIVSLGHSLGLRVVAEGIEQRDQVDLLQSLQCDSGQGFYFARPLPAEALAARLEPVAWPDELAA